MTSRIDTSVATGVVVAQNPVAGIKVSPHTTVDLTLARNVSVPDLSGQSITAAQAALQALGLSSITRQAGSAATEGSVLGVNPAVGTRVAPGTLVTLTVAAPLQRHVIGPSYTLDSKDGADYIDVRYTATPDSGYVINPDSAAFVVTWYRGRENTGRGHRGGEVKVAPVSAFL